MLSIGIELTAWRVRTKHGMRFTTNSAKGPYHLVDTILIGVCVGSYRVKHEYMFVNMNIHQSWRSDIRIRTSIDGEYSLISKQYSRIFVSGNYLYSASLNTH